MGSLTTVNNTTKPKYRCLKATITFDRNGALATGAVITASVDLDAVLAPATNSAVTPLGFLIDFAGSTQYECIWQQ